MKYLENVFLLPLLDLSTTEFVMDDGLVVLMTLWEKIGFRESLFSSLNNSKCFQFMFYSVRHVSIVLYISFSTKSNSQALSFDFKAFFLRVV